MYHELHRLSRLGFKAAKIGRELVMDRRTVKKYLEMSEQQYMDFIDRQDSRNKLLDKYEGFVLIIPKSVPGIIFKSVPLQSY